MSKVVAIIPARYDSTRLPGKPLALIGDTSMIVRVYQQAMKSYLFTNVTIATDDERILHHCQQHQCNAILTSKDHLNGTTRCLEAANLLSLEQEDIVVNIQGDEPFIQPEQLQLLISCFDHAQTEIATLCKRLYSDIDNPNIVKLTKSLSGNALYFSRSVIPYQRDKDDNTSIYYKHIGLYAYKLKALYEIAHLKESQLETTEKLEQLRWLEHGYRIHVKETLLESISVDTPEDLVRANEFIKS